MSIAEMKVSPEGLFWTEKLPEGRVALYKNGKEIAYNVQSYVHGYGGGAFLPILNGVLFFDAKTMTLYLQTDRTEAIYSGNMVADFAISKDQKTVFCVLQDGKDYLLKLDLENGSSEIIGSDFDFYASPRLSLDGNQLAYIGWSHPNMPWDESTLVIGDAKISYQSIIEFVWTDQGVVFASDQNGFWNLYCLNRDKIEPIFEIDADCSTPLWKLARKNFAYDPITNTIACTYQKKGIYYIAKIFIESRGIEILPITWSLVQEIDCLNGVIYILGSITPEKHGVYSYFEGQLSPYVESVRDAHIEVSYVETKSSVDLQMISGFYYKGEKEAPLIIRAHGGPTAAVAAVFTDEIIFWNEQGFSVLEVNYRGSSNFGRTFRQSLLGNFGYLDAQDCLDLAQAISDGRVLIAKGGSSGASTAFAMARLSSDVRALIASYPVADFEALEEVTHPFEQFYMRSLVGERHLKERSPLFFANRLTIPVLLMHGDQDSIVPICQSELLHQQMKNSQFVIFPGEGHGWRKQDTITRVRDLERSFIKDLCFF